VILQPDATHDPALESWVDSANSTATDFPIQNLPFGRFRRKYQRGADGSWHLGVAIGDRVLDLKAAGLFESTDMNTLMKRVSEITDAPTTASSCERSASGDRRSFSRNCRRNSRVSST